MKEFIILAIVLVISGIFSAIKKSNVGTTPPATRKHDFDSTLIEDAELIEAEKLKSKRADEVKARYDKTRISPVNTVVVADADQSQEDKISDITERFNITEAVIYSEILKPKF